MIRRAEVFALDREDIRAVIAAWERIKPFIPAGCDPAHTATVDAGMRDLRAALEGETP